MRKLLFIAILLLAGCKKDPPYSNLNSMFDVSLNGTAYQELSLTGNYSPTTHLVNIQTVLWQTNNTNMSIVFSDTLVIGKTYTFNDDIGLTCAYDPGHSYTGGFGTGHGTFTLTKWDEVAKDLYGTFSGVMPGATAGDSVVVTGGTFRIMGYVLEN
jgi:hypothetical protein